MRSFLGLCGLLLSLTACPTATPSGDVDAGFSRELRCGGKRGLDCPGEGVCLDEPNDDCDPQTLGNDCGGWCQCSPDEECPSQYHWNADPFVCACVEDAN